MIKFLEHTADVKFRVTAKSEKGIFEETAKAFSQYATGKKNIGRNKMKRITLNAGDNCRALAIFIDELLFLLDSEGFIVARAEVEIIAGEIRAKLFGDSAKKYEIMQVKAATYAEMYFKKVKDNWEAQVVLDV